MPKRGFLSSLLIVAVCLAVMGCKVGWDGYPTPSTTTTPVPKTPTPGFTPSPTATEASTPTPSVTAPPNHPPNATILSPTAAGTYREDGLIPFRALVADAEDPPHELTISWEVVGMGALNVLAVPDAQGNIEGFAYLSAGEHAVQLVVEDRDGARGADSVRIVVDEEPVDPDPAAPLCSISQPTAAQVATGTNVAFEALVSDSEDLPGDLVVTWSSDQDGLFGAPVPDAGGTAQFGYSGLSNAIHRIELRVVDSDSLECTDSRVLTVNTAPSAPVVSIRPSPASPADDLIASLDAPGVDPDGTAVAHRWSWARNGSAVPALTGQTVPSAQTADGDEWVVEVVASDGINDGPPGTASVRVEDDGGPVTGGPCALPPTYERITHTEGNHDFQRVAYAPDGSYALILGYPDRLYRYDPGAQGLSLLGDGGGSASWTALTFAEDGSFALIGGGDAFSNPAPVLYRYAPSTGLEAVPDIVGFADGKLPTMGRIADIAQRPGTGSFTVLSDDAQGLGSGIAYLNQVEPDWTTGAHAWSYHGALNMSQGASSISWGTNLGQPIALSVTHFTDMMRFEPLLASNQFSRESTPNTGNLKRVIFDPVGGTVAWVLQWSSGAVYAWEGVLRNDWDNKFSFGSGFFADMAVSPDGAWKTFVGRSGLVWFSNSPWRPIDHTLFVQQDIPNFDQPPWNGVSNTYLNGAAFRPGTCRGMIVGDATSGQGLLVEFSLQTP